MCRRVEVIVLLSLLILPATACAVVSKTPTLSVVYQPPKQDIPDFYLVPQLIEALALQAELEIIVPEEDSTLPPAPNRRFDADRLTEWGHEIGCRYIVYLKIEDRRISTHKQTSIPWLLSRYVIEGRLIGVYSLIDLYRGKTVGHWQLAARLTGPRQWQFARDYPEDPDLQMSAPRKMTFLKELEKRSVEEIITSIKPHLKGR